jgi:putative acetyltransferase
MTAISIRRARVEDAAAMARLMGDPAVYPGLMQMPHASEEVHRARLADALAPGKPDVLLVAELGGEVVGSCGLHPAGPSPRRRHAMMLGISVRSDAQGKGVGRALMQALCDYADRWIGLLRLELDVFADNERAIALYRRFGFEIEGLHRGYALRDGAYADSYSMARLHPSPPAIAADTPAAPT